MLSSSPQRNFIIIKHLNAIIAHAILRTYPKLQAMKGTFCAKQFLSALEIEFKRLCQEYELPEGTYGNQVDLSKLKD